MKLGRDEVLMIPITLRCFGHICPRADPEQGKNGSRRPFFKQFLLQTRRVQQQPECITMIFTHMGWSVVVFGSIPKSNFWHVHCTQVSDRDPLDLLLSLRAYYALFAVLGYISKRPEKPEILLPVKFRWIPISCFRWDVENVKSSRRLTTDDRWQKTCCAFGSGALKQNGKKMENNFFMTSKRFRAGFELTTLKFRSKRFDHSTMEDTVHYLQILLAHWKTWCVYKFQQGLNSLMIKCKNCHQEFNLAYLSLLHSYEVILALKTLALMKISIQLF